MHILLLIIIIIIIIIMIIIIIRVMCVSGHFRNTRLFSNFSFSVLCSGNFEIVMRWYDETNVHINPFLILNMEKPKILNGIFFSDNKSSLYKLFLQTVITWVNQFMNYVFDHFYMT